MGPALDSSQLIIGEEEGIAPTGTGKISRRAALGV